MDINQHTREVIDTICLIIIAVYCLIQLYRQRAGVRK